MTSKLLYTYTVLPTRKSYRQACYRIVLYSFYQMVLFLVTDMSFHFDIMAITVNGQEKGEGEW